MKLGRLLSLVFILSTLLGIQHEAKASHAMGADFSYQCVGQDSFLITLNFYRDCDGTTAPSSASVTIRSAACNQGPINLTLTRNSSIVLPDGNVIGNGDEISALCDQSISSSTCNGGNLPGVQQYQYSGLFVAPAACPDWTIGYSVYARNAIVTTMSNPSTSDLYIETTLNNTNGICNNSPIFSGRPVPYFCYLDSINYNHGTIDYDGDSLVYTLITPLEGPNDPMTYQPGFSATNPLTTNGTFTFDPTTGQMNFVPQVAQVGVITILVEEYRNGVLVGSTMRDIQVVVLAQPLCNPPYGTIVNQGIDSSSVTGGVFIGPYEIESCPGDTIEFQITMGGDSIHLTSNAATALPGATFDTTMVTIDSVVGEFFWVPTTSDTGFNVFSLDFGIYSCPVDRTSSRTVRITVLDGTTASNDTTYCTAGDPVPLGVIGGSNFTWSPTTGLDNPNIYNPLASPTVTTEYIVQSDLSARCKNRDTVVVEVVPNFVWSVDPVDDTVDVCRNSLVQLTVATDTNYGPYTYSWTPASGLNDPNVANPIASPISTTTYIATVTSDTGCTIRDSITIDVTGVGPQVFIQPEEATVCPGDTIQLTTEVFPVTCGPAIGLGSCGPTNPPGILTYGTGTSTASVTPFAGANPDARYQVLYRATDLQNSGIGAGTIIRMRLNIGTKASSRGFSDFTIKMGCTNSTGLSRSAWENASTVVFTSASFFTNQGSNDIILSQPYDWDGISNLVIEFCYGNATTTNAGGNDLLTSTNVTYPAAMSAQSTTSNDGCSLPASQINTNEPVFQVPNVTFFLCDALTPNYTYSWSPATGLNNPNIPNPRATVNQPTVYTVTVSDTSCDGSDFVVLDIDTASISVSNDTALCNADSVGLFVDVSGVLPQACGTNGSICAGTSTNYTVGTGTVYNEPTEYPAPFGDYYGSATQQFLYLASDLNAAGITQSTLTSIGFNIRLRTSATFVDYTVKMKCTNASSLSIGAPESGTQTVINPRNITAPASGWYQLNFDNTFDWDGQSNLIVEICYSNPTHILNTSTYATNKGYTASIYSATDLGNICNGAAAAEEVNGSNMLPNVRFSTCTTPQLYSVTWSPSSTLTDPNIENPVAFPTTTTTYYVTVVTPTGCTKQDSVTVGIGTLPYTLSNDTTVCINEPLDLFVTGGTSYDWSPATGLSCSNCANPSVSTDTARQFIVTITDTNSGCVVTDTVNVDLYSTPSAPFTGNASTCLQDSIELDAGPGFVTYQWNTNENTQSIWASSAGLYIVELTDSNGCTITDSIELFVSSLPPVDLGADSSLCVGDSMVLNAGAGFVSYNWLPGNTTDSTLTVFSTDEYIVEVTDSNGCSSSDTINVYFNTVPVVELGNDTLACFRDSVRLVAGSTPAYTYLWSDGSTDSVLYVTAPGPDTVVVTVFGGATCFDSDTIIVNYQPEVVVDLGNDTITCNSDSITFDAGAGFVSYLWNTGDVTQTIRTNIEGYYSVTVTNALGCTGVDTVYLDDISPEVSLGNDTILCEMDTLLLNAGSGFASYSWNTATLTDTTAEVYTTGTYAVTVTDNNGCTTIDSIYVQFNPLPIVDLGNDTTLCASETTTLDAGNTGANYLWNTSETSQTIIPGPAGLYSVVVSDSVGCSSTDTIDVSYYPVPTVDLGPDQALCGGDTITLSVTGQFMSFNWNTNESTPTIEVTTGGTYSVTVTDGNGCPGVDTIVITDVSPQVSVADQSICLGETAVLDPGAGYVSYQWSTNQTTQTISVDTNGTFTLTVTDMNGCEGYDTVTVTVNPLPTVSITNAQDTICLGDPLVLQATTGFVSYLWSTADTTSSISVTQAGTYTVQVADANGCVNEATVTIATYAPISISLTDMEICPEETDTLFGPEGYQTYTWTGGSTDPNLVVTDAGVYYLTVSDENLCLAVDSAVVSEVGVEVTATADPSLIDIGETTTLNADAVNGSGNYSYSWEPAELVSDATVQSPTTSPDADTVFTVSVTDLNTGCVSTDTVLVIVFDETRYVFPEAFTPNGDGNNDEFYLLSTGDVVMTEFRIHNRWGELVHDTPTPWNGTYNGNDQPNGTYVFTAVIEITTATGTTTENVQGTFNIVR